MKRMFLCFLFILTFIFLFTYDVDAKPVHSSFQDDELYHCVINALNLGSVDGTTDRSDSYIATDAELAKLTQLVCNTTSTNNVSINSTKGIEKLINLQSLNLDNNYITRIDLSKNVNLTELSLTNNKLTSIDLTNQPNLVNLSVANNQLTSIDLSKNSFLSTINISDNAITSMILKETLTHYQTSIVPQKRQVTYQEEAGKYYIALKDMDATFDPMRVIVLPQNDALYDLQNGKYVFDTIPKSISYRYQVNANFQLDVVLNIVQPVKENPPIVDNTQKEEVLPVPDTNFSKSTLIVMIGCCLVLAGTGVFYFRLGRKKS